MGLTYVVIRNDSLSRIASRNNVSINDLLAVNGFVRSSVIVPGQIIKLPDTASNAPANRTSVTYAVSASVSVNSTSSSVAGPTYVVQRNDSLSLIASKTKVSLSALLSANKFTSSSVIVPGQIIKLPDTASNAPANRTSVASVASARVSVSATSSSVAGPTYVVQRNDSLSLIASKTKVTLSALLSANKFTRTSVIVPGQVIKLPASASVMNASSALSTSSVSANATTPTKLQQVLDFARAQVGKPYKFAAAGPSSYDCSGLTKASMAIAGVKLPHQSLAQSKLGTAIDWKTTPIQAGDLVFTFSSKSPTVISHVGIAISSTHWIEAPNTGSFVRISKLPSSTRIQAVRRFL
jgi:peptidoglycan endopeptidase LytE